jgi:hypothetical protein
VRRALVIVLALLVAACGGGHTTRKREIGYKGKARLDAYLAAGRFLEKSGYAVTSEPGWPDYDQGGYAVAILPASVVSTQAYARELEEWVAGGGHLICLVERAESYHDDWARWSPGGRSDEAALPEDLDGWFERAGLTVGRGDAVKAERLAVDGVEHEVFAESAVGVTVEGGTRQALGQVGFGEGLITVMADARPFRNRYLADHDHAALLLALVDSSPYEGGVVIVRDAALSLWKLLGERAWPALLGLLALSTAIDFVAGQQIDRAPPEARRTRKAWLLFSLAVNLGMLGFFKYHDFFVVELCALLGALGFGVDPENHLLRLVLPAGISFYTFQTMAYTIDIWRGHLRHEPDPLKFALYVVFFPQLVAGPVERATHLLPQFSRPFGLSPQMVRQGVFLILLGFVKKVVFADASSTPVRRSLSATSCRAT